MQIYRQTTLLCEEADFAKFKQLLGASILAGSSEPFLLIRQDGVRLLLVTHEGSIMLCLASGLVECLVSYGPTYSDSPITFVGILGSGIAKSENFVDPIFAMLAVRAFFDCGRMSDHVDFRQGIPDKAIVTFPEAISKRPREETESLQLSVEVTSELKTDMKDVCEYLDDVANDPDENIDFDDAIQIGSLVGGRISRRKDTYLFSHRTANGSVWTFSVPRTVLEGIADGTIAKLSVEATVPKKK